MFAIIAISVLMDTGPFVDRETCAFLPQDHPCHIIYDPPPPICQGGNGQTVCE